MSQNFWDARFSGPTPVFGAAPNVSFQALIDQLTPGRLLLPAEGQGRQALYAARLGWQVEAFDSSEVARRYTLQKAQEAGLSLDYQLCGIEHYQPTPRHYDLIAMVFVHLPSSLRPLVLRRWVGALAPGGYLQIVAFGPDQDRFRSGGPPDRDMRPPVETMLGDLSGLNVLTARAFEDELDEGSHKGRASLVEIIAQAT
ncbi:MAG: class I SAM-dependent methyltransferase [Candidatus Sericytochromatia bacterium]